MKEKEEANEEQKLKKNYSLLKKKQIKRKILKVERLLN